MERQHRNVLVLSGCQATLQTTGATMTAVTGLAGFALADDKSFATVPLTFYVLGSAATTIPASLLMKSLGRRGGFQVGTAIGMCGAAVCSAAMVAANFWLLCAGMFVMMAISSASSGLLLNKSGWSAVNYGSIPFLVLAAGATLWLVWKRRRRRSSSGSGRSCI